MPDLPHADLLLLTVLTTAWCALHSVLISVSLTGWLAGVTGRAWRFYRLFYNLVAVLTLIPLGMYRWSIRGEYVFDWHGWLRLPQALMIGTAVLLFVLGARRYDARRFLGLAQLGEPTNPGGITASGQLDTSGILGLVRHPWYAGLLLLLWARPLDPAGLVISSVFSAYLLVGARLEENKLAREFGDTYQQYRQRVSMLFPLKWLLMRLRR